jgi:lipopolysaccharide transport system permease protein
VWLVVLLPIPALIHLILIAGIALLVSCVNVFFRDVGVALGVLLQAWFFLTPIFYHPSIVPAPITWFILANPLASLISAYRDLLINRVLPNPGLILTGGVTSLALLIVGYLVFRRYRPLFVEEL